MAAAEGDVKAEVVPDFGFQKFRVGVKIADGSYVPPGASTAGSTFHIVFSNDEGVVEEVDCTSEVPKDDPESDIEEDPTSTFCIPNKEETPELVGRMAAAAAEVGDDDDLQPEQYFEMQPGETATITQMTAGHTVQDHQGPVRQRGHPQAHRQLRRLGQQRR